MVMDEALDVGGHGEVGVLWRVGGVAVVAEVLGGVTVRFGSYLRIRMRDKRRGERAYDGVDVTSEIPRQNPRYAPVVLLGPEQAVHKYYRRILAVSASLRGFMVIVR